MNPPDGYKLARSQIEHENTLISQRITWYLTLQGLLFTAFFVALGQIWDAKFPPPLRPHLAFAVWMLMLVGASSSIVCYLLIRAAYRQIDAVQDWWLQQGASPAFPPVTGQGHVKAGGMAFSGAEFVLVLFFVWLGIAVRFAPALPAIG